MEEAVLGRLEVAIDQLTSIQTAQTKAITELNDNQSAQTKAVNKLSENVQKLSRVLLGEMETETPGLLHEHRKMKGDVDELLAFKRVCMGLLKAIPKLAGAAVFIYVIAGGAPQDVLDLITGLF